MATTKLYKFAVLYDFVVLNKNSFINNNKIELPYTYVDLMEENYITKEDILITSSVNLKQDMLNMVLKLPHCHFEFVFTLTNKFIEFANNNQ